MGKGFVVLLLFIAYCRSCSCIEEPRCSKYEFEEKVLEKVLRFEHKMEIMANTLNEISTKVKDDIHNMKTELETRGGEQTTAFNQLEKNLQTEWTDMKKSFKDLSGISTFLSLDVRMLPIYPIISEFVFSFYM